MSFILDLVLVFIFLVFFMLMAKKGFVKSVHSLLGNILAVILSIILVSPATELVLKTPVGDIYPTQEERQRRSRHPHAEHRILQKNR